MPAPVPAATLRNISGHEDARKICARFVSQTFNCPEAIPHPPAAQQSSSSTGSSSSHLQIPPTLAHFIGYALHRARLPTPVTFHALGLLHPLTACFPAARGWSGPRLFSPRSGSLRRSSATTCTRTARGPSSASARSTSRRTLWRSRSSRHQRSWARRCLPTGPPRPPHPPQQLVLAFVHPLLPRPSSPSRTTKQESSPPQAHHSSNAVRTQAHSQCHLRPRSARRPLGLRHLSLRAGASLVAQWSRPRSPTACRSGESEEGEEYEDGQRKRTSSSATDGSLMLSTSPSTMLSSATPSAPHARSAGASANAKYNGLVKCFSLPRPAASAADKAVMAGATSGREF